MPPLRTNRPTMGGRVEFEDLKKCGKLVRYLWDAAALVCLEEHPLRYTELGTGLTAWAGRRPSDTALTRTVKRLRRTGLIATQPGRDSGWRAPYLITDAGRLRLAEIRELVAANVDSTKNQTAAANRSATTADPMLTPDGRRQTGHMPSLGEARPDRDGATVDADHEQRARAIDTSKAHPARRYNYWIGGKDHFIADRESGDEIARVMPTVRIAALQNRAFLRRAVHYLAQTGIRQFLDIGTGIPAPNNTHEVAQAVHRDSRVIYVDNDPIVLTHARVLFTGTPEGRTAYIDADLREPEKILNHPDVLATLNFDQPIGLLLIAVLHFVGDTEDVYGIVERLVQAFPPGSFLAIAQATMDFMTPEEKVRAEAVVASGQHGAMHFRSRDAVSRFFNGLDLVAPGVVPLAEWHNTDPHIPDPADIGGYGAVAKIP
jgi:DNA-binding PadR family transcriptional regulator